MNTLVNECKIQDVVNSTADDRQALNDLIAYSKELLKAAEEGLKKQKLAAAKCEECDATVVKHCRTCNEPLCLDCLVECSSDDCKNVTCEKCEKLCIGDTSDSFGGDTDCCDQPFCEDCMVYAASACDRKLQCCQGCMDKYVCDDCDECGGCVNYI